MKKYELSFANPTRPFCQIWSITYKDEIVFVLKENETKVLDFTYDKKIFNLILKEARNSGIIKVVEKEV